MVVFVIRLFTCSLSIWKFLLGFVFAKLQSFVKINPPRNGEITLLFTDVCKSCHGREFLQPLKICGKYVI